MIFQWSLIMVTDRKSWKVLLAICSRCLSCVTLESFGLECQLSHHARPSGPGFPQQELLDHQVNNQACYLMPEPVAVEIRVLVVVICFFYFLFLGIAHYPLIQPMLLCQIKMDLNPRSATHLSAYLALGNLLALTELEFLHLSSFFICLVKMPNRFLWAFWKTKYHAWIAIGTAILHQVTFAASRE